jgi:hypothetical protein
LTIEPQLSWDSIVERTSITVICDYQEYPFWGACKSVLLFIPLQEKWRRGCDSQQNVFFYIFAFLMLPTQINNPKTSYVFMT